jgi:hypothetical protein
MAPKRAREFFYYFRSGHDHDYFGSCANQTKQCEEQKKFYYFLISKKVFMNGVNASKGAAAAAATKA